jgi:hypothetical protein
VAFTPQDLADHAQFVGEFNRRNGIIYRLRGAARRSATDILRADMSAGTLLAPRISADRLTVAL